MIALQNTRVLNFGGALRGMRNPLESWNKSDSLFSFQVGGFNDPEFLKMGSNDHNLAMKLALAGSDHGKFLRQIFISVDITAPLYWWKEFDTYKVGTVANSTSTMHKLGSRPLALTDFSFDDEEGELNDSTFRQDTIFDLNRQIVKWKELNAQLKDMQDPVEKQLIAKLIKKVWRRIVQDLPSSYNQTRTVTLNYENARNIYFARKNHKLVEWHVLCHWIEDLPYSELITTPRKTPREKELEDILSKIADLCNNDLLTNKEAVANIRRIATSAIEE